MAKYLYRCDACGRERVVRHRMADSPEIRCDECGEEMRRAIRQAPAVNWNGDTAASPIHPEIQRLIDTAPERRDRFEERHEQHEKASTQNG